jgi:thiol-disulfide isomerase/thioredoxin
MNSKHILYNIIMDTNTNMDKTTSIQIPELTDNQSFHDLWSEIVKRDEEGHKDITFFYFGATWCEPCHKIKPKALSFMSKLIQQKKARCYEIDIDKCDAGRGWCVVNSVPAIVKFRGKTRTNIWAGSNLEIFLRDE